MESKHVANEQRQFRHIRLQHSRDSALTTVAAAQNEQPNERIYTFEAYEMHSMSVETKQFVCACERVPMSSSCISEMENCVCYPENSCFGSDCRIISIILHAK